MPEAISIGDVVPLPLSNQLISNKRSLNAEDFIVKSGTKSVSDYRLKVAQAIIDCPYNLIEGLEDVYLPDQVVKELTNLIVNKVWYNVSYGDYTDNVLDIMMECAEL